MDRIFITGASGFIGKALAISLANSGTNVHVLVRASSNVEGLDHPNIKKFIGDIQNSKSIRDAMIGCDKVYHLAGLAKMWMKNKKSYHDVNVAGTLNVLSVAYKSGIDKIVFTSTGGVLPPATDHPSNEFSQKRPELYTEYERTKNRSEEIALAFQEKGLPIVIVYPTKVFGPGPIGDCNTATMMIRDYLNGKWKIIPGNGKGTMNYVYIDDVIAGLISAMERANSGSRYLLGGENASYDRFFSTVKKLTGVNRRLYHIPYPVIRSIAWFEDNRTKFFGAKPIITSEWVKKLRYNWSKDVTRANAELDLNPLSLEVGIRQTIDWLYQTNQVKIKPKVYKEVITATSSL